MKPVNVMLVDDEERFLSTTQKLLEKKGYNVITASSGMEALEKLAVSPVDIVLLDVKMPGMDGLEVLKRITKDFSGIDVIMLTGHATVESAVEGLKSGALDYLVKPADVDAIAEKIRNAFIRREKNKDQSASRREYFHRLRLRLTIALLAAFLLPHILLSAYFHFQFTSTLRNIGKLNIMAIAGSQKNTIDLFLQERVVNLFSLFRKADLKLAPEGKDMDSYLQILRQASDAFIDVGVFDDEGIQIGYAGPYAYLQGRDYSHEKWFRGLMDQERQYFISDIYMGFRNKPHFTIAVRQMVGDAHFIIRSTLDPDKFYMFMRTIAKGDAVECSLINGEGLYQVVDPDRGKLLGESDYVPSNLEPSGVGMIEAGDDSFLVAHVWLKETPWALLVRQPLKVTYAQMFKTRRVMTATLAVILIVLTAVIAFIANRLIGNAQAMAQSRDELQHQLLHASKLASVGELATGVAHEINNPLATIVATSGVIKDMLNPEFNLDHSPDKMIKELEAIDAAAFRARRITQQLLDFGRKREPVKVPCNVNDLLDTVLDGLKERAFALDNITINKEYDPRIPVVLLDPDQVRQVFLNLVNNAGDAIQGPGTITITTRRDDRYIRIIVKDTGSGMGPDQMKKIFDPFFTTKETGKGTGLGLSVSLSIVESMGGTIDVQSLEGVGSSFTVTLPIRLEK